MATATSATIAARIRPHQDARQRLDERVPKLASEVRALRERLIEASVAAATAPTQNGEEREIAEIERRLAKAERELDAAQRERDMAGRTIAALEDEYRRARERELTVDARRAHHDDFRALVEALARVSDVVGRDEQRRREVELAGLNAAGVFGNVPYPRDILDVVRETMIRAAEDRNVDRGEVQFEGDPLVTWRPKGARR